MSSLYLLDTNALSEAPKKVPNKGFIEWLSGVNELSIMTSCIVIGEINKGIHTIDDAEKKKTFQDWLQEVQDSFAGRIVEIDISVCLLWGELMAKGRIAGKTPPAINALIAAQCIINNVTLVTRNIKDFEQFIELKVISPWK